MRHTITLSKKEYKAFKKFLEQQSPKKLESEEEIKKIEDSFTAKMYLKFFLENGFKEMNIWAKKAAIDSEFKVLNKFKVHLLEKQSFDVFAMKFVITVGASQWFSGRDIAKYKVLTKKQLYKIFLKLVQKDYSFIIEDFNLNGIIDYDPNEKTNMTKN